MAMSRRTDRERQANKQRSLRLIKSLDPDDDERTNISKKISWLLRQGAKVAGVFQDADGWVTMADLMNAEVLASFDLGTVTSVIAESNRRKLRYELKETPNGTVIRAYTKEERKELEGASGASGAKADNRGDGSFRGSVPAHRYETTDAPQGIAAAAAAAAAMPWPQASYPASSSSPDLGWPGMGFNPMMMHLMNPWMSLQHQAAVAAAAAVPQPGKFAGRIKSFNLEKGFGFIECAHTHSQYGRDVFLHKSQIGDTPVGSFVTFTCEVNKQGMPQAKDVGMIGAPASGVIGKGGKGDGGKVARGRAKGADGSGLDKWTGKGTEGSKGKGEKGKRAKGQGKGKSDGKEKGERRKGEAAVGQATMKGEAKESAVDEGGAVEGRAGGGKPDGEAEQVDVAVASDTAQAGAADVPAGDAMSA
mmetsp:Transcript_110694/g.309350  ORF Transcript_110694/g.309350 Transcript_110694/m.309350 type:complete len:419 (+) Transcript_110694:158-1414(+)